MKIHRQSLVLCAVLLTLPAVQAWAQAGYPTRPLRLIVPSSAGGGTDIVARIIQPKLSERLGQPVVIENRPGAGTMIGIEIASKAAPDGYTILMGLSTLAINSAVYAKVPYDPVLDFAPITQLIASPAVLFVHPSLPVKTVKELIAFARARPGQLNYASAGTGTFPHMSMELFLTMARLRMEHIPYKGTGPAMIDMLAGQTATMVAPILTPIPHIRSGRLRGLGITSSERSPVAPEIPTVAEAGLRGYEAVQWYGALAPARTPPEIVARLHQDFAAILQLPDIRKRFAGDGTQPVGSTPEQFRAYIQSELAKWAKVAQAAGIKR
ncbi:MAG TPA: tripartite tricarboxylate transporter substrate binding protein [Burkholderiales bacterium]